MVRLNTETNYLVIIGMIIIGGLLIIRSCAVDLREIRGRYDCQPGYTKENRK